jgi:hypothetical protein
MLLARTFQKVIGDGNFPSAEKELVKTHTLWPP